ncbi:MAG: FkbM family methyltransferase [Candidatus Gastranaerophilales bacterium]|nr:FkbM family methyltransferase [Candidatus Gastranaerophilales bacterium]
MYIYSFSEISENSKICIYGSNNLEQCFVKLIKLIRKDIQIVSFIDSKKIDQIDGIPILKIKELADSDLEYDLILVSPFKIKEVDNIKYNSDSHKLKIVQWDLFNLGRTYFVDYTMLEITDEYYLKNKQNYDKAEEILKYEEDKELYREIIKLRLDRKQLENFRKFLFEYITTKNPIQYIDFINKLNIRTIIDGGVFDGLSLLKFQDLLPTMTDIYGFEPFEKFVKESIFYDFLDKNKIHIIPLGLWHQKAKLEFKENVANQGASKIVNNGQDITELSTISIDEFVSENNINKVDLIKLDVEGAELNTLKGSINTIINHRPQLAISIYHSHEEMFSIPIFLNELLENYTFRLGHYTLTSFETILYGIPNELM